LVPSQLIGNNGKTILASSHKFFWQHQVYHSVGIYLRFCSHLFVNSVRIALPFCPPFCKLLYFADDMKFLMEINLTDGCVSLQNSFDCFVNWYNTKELKINVSKRRVMKFSRSRDLIHYDFHISGTKILRIFDEVPN